MVARNFMVAIVGFVCFSAGFERVSVLELELEDGKSLCHAGKVRLYVLYLNICRGFQLCCPGVADNRLEKVILGCLAWCYANDKLSRSSLDVIVPTLGQVFHCCCIAVEADWAILV